MIVLFVSLFVVCAIHLGRAASVSTVCLCGNPSRPVQMFPVYSVVRLRIPTKLIKIMLFINLNLQVKFPIFYKLNFLYFIHIVN